MNADVDIATTENAAAATAGAETAGAANAADPVTGRTPDGVLVGPHIARDTCIAVLRAYMHLQHELARFFRAEGLTGQQYNALRILYVRSGPAGLPMCEISRRLIEPAPDITRLIDRMELAGLVRRSRTSNDRREVLIQLLPKGREKLIAMEAALLAEHERVLAHMSHDELHELQRLALRVVTPVAQTGADSTDNAETWRDPQ